MTNLFFLDLNRFNFPGCSFLLCSESFSVKSNNDRQAAYVSEKDRPKNIDHDTVDSEFFSLDDEERELLLVNYGPDSQFRYVYIRYFVLSMLS